MNTNVLSKIDRCIEKRDLNLDEMIEVRVAVAELIDAATLYRASQLAVEAGATLRKYRRRNSAGMRLVDALARVGGAA